MAPLTQVPPPLLQYNINLMVELSEDISFQEYKYK